MGDRIRSRPVSRASGRSLSIGGLKPRPLCRLDREYTRQRKPGRAEKPDQRAAETVGAPEKGKILLSCGSCSETSTGRSGAARGSGPRRCTLCRKRRCHRPRRRVGAPERTPAKRFPLARPGSSAPGAVLPRRVVGALSPVFVRTFEAEGIVPSIARKLWPARSVRQVVAAKVRTLSVNRSPRIRGPARPL